MLQKCSKLSKQRGYSGVRENSLPHAARDVGLKKNFHFLYRAIERKIVPEQIDARAHAKKSYVRVCNVIGTRPFMHNVEKTLDLDSEQ